MLVTCAGASASLANGSLLTLTNFHPGVTATRSGSSQGPERGAGGRRDRLESGLAYLEQSQWPVHLSGLIQAPHAECSLMPTHVFQGQGSQSSHKVCPLPCRAPCAQAGSADGAWGPPARQASGSRAPHLPQSVPGSHLGSLASALEQLNVRSCFRDPSIRENYKHSFLWILGYFAYLE